MSRLIGLFAMSRKTRKVEMICGPEVPPSEQRKKLEEIYNSGSDEFYGGTLYALQPVRAFLSFPHSKKMKKSLSSLPLVAAALLLFGFSANAQRYNPETILPANTATVAATAATNLSNVIIDVTKQDSVLLQIESMANANGAYTLTFPIYSSVDRSVWDLMQPQILAISFNGVTKQTITTNIPSYGAGYLKIPYVTNATASIGVTNLVIKRSIKIP